MERILTYWITEEKEGQKVLNFLRREGFSKHILTGLKTTPQGLLLNGSRPFGDTLLKKGDCLQVRLVDETPSEKIIPTPMELHILYEDEDLLVINKEADVPVHPSIGNYENTLANGVAWYYGQKGQDFIFRCINRLDRDTTGALILGKNAYSAAKLSQMMRNRQIQRTYLALAKGKTPKMGTISAPIGRVRESAILRQVDFRSGEAACTHYQRLDYRNDLSLLELHLDTGRTHQIRVHMQYLGYPLIGDYLYYPSYDRIGRQALHSYQLTLVHPVTGKPLLFQAPVPRDMTEAFLKEACPGNS